MNAYIIIKICIQRYCAPNIVIYIKTKVVYLYVQLPVSNLKVFALTATYKFQKCMYFISNLKECIFEHFYMKSYD